MEKAYLNINIPNIISVGIIAMLLYVAHLGLKKYIFKNMP